MSNPQQTSLSRPPIAPALPFGRILVVLALAGALIYLVAAPESRPPDALGLQSGPPKTVEDWRGNSASIRRYID